MTYYLKLDVPKYKEGYDPFEYVKAVKTIADELEASNSKAILMARFTLKCKKAKKWYKTYITSRVNSMT